jgi:predicted Zn-dependent protease
MIQYDFQVSVGEDTVYSVVVFEYPAGKGPNPDTDAYLKLVNAYAKGSESRLRKRGPATIAGRSGFEAIADDGKSKLSHLIDVVPAGDRIYMLVTAGPKSHATGDDAERFRDSFRVLGDASDAESQSAANPPAQ